MLEKLARVSCRAMAAALCAAASAAGAQPMLVHLHGMAFSQDGAALLVSSHVGLTAFQDGSWSHALETGLDLTGFSVAERAIYASGHPAPGSALRNPLGLAASTDGGRNWRSLALEGQADFHIIAAGYRTGAVYVVSHLPNAAMPAPGIHLTLDDGRTWRRAGAGGLGAELFGLAAHPRQPATLAAATDGGLYVSRDRGERFRRYGRREPVTAVAFDRDGRRVLYAGPLSSSIGALEIDKARSESIGLPALRGDYVTHLAPHPEDPLTMAVGTRRLDVYLTSDGGVRWRQIARQGDLP